VPAFCGHAEPACTTWSEKTRVTGARHRAAHDHHAAAELCHARTDVPGTPVLTQPCHVTITRSRNPQATTPTGTDNRNLHAPLDKHLLTLVSMVPSYTL
jgi:hypothetical protein